MHAHKVRRKRFTLKFAAQLVCIGHPLGMENLDIIPSTDQLGVQL